MMKDNIQCINDGKDSGEYCLIKCWWCQSPKQDPYFKNIIFLILFILLIMMPKIFIFIRSFVIVFFILHFFNFHVWHINSKHDTHKYSIPTFTSL